VRSSLGKKQPIINPPKKNYNDQQRKEMDYDQPHMMSNEKTQSIKWTKWPIGALVVVGSLRPTINSLQNNFEVGKTRPSFP